MSNHNSEDILDCLIIGAGPAGLTAAIYLLRYRRNIKLVDFNESRALAIPVSHNYPAFIKGISGPCLLKRLKTQLSEYNAPITQEKIESLELSSKGIFIANKKIYSKTVILATGVRDVKLPLYGHKQATKKGLVRYCPVCDAFEVIDKNIAVIGNGKSGVHEAIFLRNYTPKVSLVAINSPIAFSDKQNKEIKQAGIPIIVSTLLRIDKSGVKINCYYDSNLPIASFDSVYCALGCAKENKLAKNLGAKIKKGEIVVSDNLETSLPGLYAAGDIVSGLNQICVAQGQAAIAATAINKYLLKH